MLSTVGTVVYQNREFQHIQKSFKGSLFELFAM